MNKLLAASIASLFLLLNVSASAGESGTWARITELQWNVNGFNVVLDQAINTPCASKNTAMVMDPTMDRNQFDVRSELSYKTVVSQLTAAYYENKQVYVFFRDDLKTCAWGAHTVITGLGIK